MRTYNLTLTLLLAFFFLTGCSNDRQKFFENERYEKMVYIVSDDDNIHDLIYDLDGKDQNVRHISIACSGTNPTEEEVTMSLTEDKILFDKYNYVNFVEDESRFAIKMDPKDYQIESNTVVYPIGAQNVLMPIKIEMPVIESLDPDKTYFIPIAIENSSPYGTVEKKENALMRIHKKNKYSNTLDPVSYNTQGYEGQGYFSMAKSVIPLTKNQVRVFIGTKRLPAEPAKQPDFILKNTVIIEVADDYSLTVNPYAPNLMDVEMLDPKVIHPGDGAYALYTNRLDPEKTDFYVYYKYRLKPNGAWTEIREAIRLPILIIE